MGVYNNCKRFPQNVMPMEKIEILNDIYKIYGFKFEGLQDFYDFLKSNPKINEDVFGSKTRVSSVTGSSDFAGASYDNALEKLIDDVEPGYQEYLQIQKNIVARQGPEHKYKEIKTVAGGVVDPVAYTTGSPKIYRASRLIKRPKFITMDIQVAYNCATSKSQVFNRALIITNLIKALERKGYSVDVNSFMAAQEGDEIIKVKFEIKKHGQRTNYQALYKSLVDVEFFRRLCFRVMEVSDVENYWRGGYGHPAGRETVWKLFNLEKEDIYFDQPDRMYIYGENIEDDFENAIKTLSLQKTIDIEREKKILGESVKVLKR